MGFDFGASIDRRVVVTFAVAVAVLVPLRITLAGLMAQPPAGGVPVQLNETL